MNNEQDQHTECEPRDDIIILHLYQSSKFVADFEKNLSTSIKADFLSWQKSLAYSLQLFADNFSLLSPLQRVLVAWFKIFNEFAIRSE